MKISQNEKVLLKSIETLSLVAYKPHPNDNPTIGYGCTKYADGSLVKLGDKITKE
ncbi:MAG: hypothetical protein PHC75_10495 [Burkholderiales bacterium]|nr:hypothetical protein [Burkholderiales bacterium]